MFMAFVVGGCHFEVILAIFRNDARFQDDTEMTKKLRNDDKKNDSRGSSRTTRK